MKSLIKHPSELSNPTLHVKKIYQHSSMPNADTGFTFFELLIVIGIISILAAIAIPAYNDYNLRAQVAESLVLTADARSAIAKYHKYTGKLPTDNFAAGISNNISGKFIKSVTIENGAIHVVFSDVSESLSNKVVSLRPVIMKNEPTSPIYFTCGYADNVQASQQIQGVNKTDINEKWLSSSCK